MMTDHPDVVPAVLAVWRAGGVVDPVDDQWGDGTRSSVLRLSCADVVIDVRTPDLTVAQAPAPQPTPLRGAS